MRQHDFVGRQARIAFSLSTFFSIAVFAGDVEIVVVGLSTPTATDTSVGPPVGITQVELGESFVVEVWATTTHPGGLAMVSLDLTFPPALADAQVPVHGALFDVFQNGDVDNFSGSVEDLSGSHPPVSPACSDTVGMGQWARVASIPMDSTGLGTLDVTALPSGSLVYVVAECGSLSAPNVVYGTTSVEIVSSAPPPITSDASGERTRFLSFSTTPVASADATPNHVAIEVIPQNLQDPNPPNAPCCPPKDFSAFESATCTAPGEANGCARWVGKPGTYFESAGNPLLGTFRASRLECEPFYHDFGSEGVFHVTGPEIVPSSSYQVLVYGPSCKGLESSCSAVSTPVVLATRRSGDIASPFNPPSESAQPDGLDVVALVNKFRGLLGAPPKASAQIFGDVVELYFSVSALDIVSVVDGFRGLAYPFFGPCACPPTVTCDATACTAAAQCPGGMCVQTCIGGVNDSQICRDNEHCTGGVCGPGFCRDRCGRCSP